MTYGYRRPPLGVRACLSSDCGKTWDLANEIVLRLDGGTLPEQNRKVADADLGYPTSVQLADGSNLHRLLSQHRRQQLLHRGDVLDAPRSEGHAVRTTRPRSSPRAGDFGVRGGVSCKRSCPTSMQCLGAKRRAVCVFRHEIQLAKQGKVQLGCGETLAVHQRIAGDVGTR